MTGPDSKRPKGEVSARNARLAASDDMAPVEGSVEIDVPAAVIGEAFFQANLWPRWNACMAWVHNRELRRGDQLNWVFEPIRPWFLYRFPATAKIIEVEEGRKVTWEVTALPGFYAQHTYTITDLGHGKSRFSSWEQATGPTFRATRVFWTAHFEFVKNRSLQGARLLEAAYRLHGQLGEAQLPKRRGPVGSLADLLGALEPLRLQPIALSDDLWAVLGGGGNSLVLKTDDQAVVIDPKMPPFATLFRWWVKRTVGAPVTTVIDTHHHVDHTFGNPQFPEATIVAHAHVPQLMRRRDGPFWRSHPDSVPTGPDLVDNDRTLEIGPTSIDIRPVPQAHTTGDVWIHITKNSRDYVVTGDIGCHGHYPFFDAGDGGADLAGWARAARQIADAYPNATVVPGHGPVGTADDLRHLAVYIEFLERSVRGSAAEGLDQAATVRNVDLSSWRLGALPVFHYGENLLTARTNVRRAFDLCTRNRASEG
ncbi:MAG: MBL fold metallo-hydrolase [Actinomycetota bacterium]|nr:MBL fold metallo-hydrolase [Actinomycetota bacterium]